MESALFEGNPVILKIISLVAPLSPSCLGCLSEIPVESILTQSELLRVSWWKQVFSRASQMYLVRRGVGLLQDADDTAAVTTRGSATYPTYICIESISAN